LKRQDRRTGLVREKEGNIVCMPAALTFSGLRTAMSRAKSSPVKRRKQIGSWGGRRKGAGRKRELKLSVRREIASKYFRRMEKARDLLQSNPPRREAIIGKLMAQFRVTHRMVERCLAEFLPNIRLNTAMYRDAIEGLQIQPLPAGKIEKLRPGTYTDKTLRTLRLIVDSAGNRKWIFCFIWRFTVKHMMLGGSELSLAVARESARKASRMLAAGQNPMDVPGRALLCGA
jgi:hypothetical protein